MFFFSEPNT
uniref:Uncharacterized protein n=1 Tax=Rhizophora mucronata TaxID=61149 RepID=A0A2P2NWW0_RHIMU